MGISCLMPTYGRPTLVQNAIACFLAQDYPAGKRRLLILDDAGQIAPQGGAGWFV
jgi:glycosyltransferase involved in cell wall biosynthesis